MMLIVNLSREIEAELDKLRLDVMRMRLIATLKAVMAKKSAGVCSRSVLRRLDAQLFKASMEK